jgi:DNA (cytosine-5)-methyltransferase 1
MTKFKEWNFEHPVDLLVGGTPCQSFSVAGLRKGLEDPRGNLALVYCGILDRFKPKWFVWENVPGVLSSSGGRDFGSFLGAVAELGYGFAYRVLDAQYFGVPQRRRRLFVVGFFGSWRGSAEVLFDRESLAGIPAPLHSIDSAGPRFFMPGNRAIDREWPETLGARDYKDPQIVCSKMFVRKLTPKEYERLLGFPDGHTALSANTKDTPRYKALGNSMAVPVMHWIGKRIQKQNQQETT